MANYLKPQSPLQKGTDYIYPLTTADQIIVDEDGTRLGDGKGNLNISAGEEILEKVNEQAAWLPPSWPFNKFTDLMLIGTTESQTYHSHFPEFFGSEDPSDFKNKPPYGTGPFYGYRTVYKPTQHLTLVELHEIHPMPGRVWTVTYDTNSGWSEWKQSIGTYNFSWDSSTATLNITL